MDNLISKKFYFIRHGQTDANKNEQMCGGGWDVPLNKEGREQAQNASLKYNNTLSGLSKIYVSPMHRAHETAEILMHNFNVDLITVEGLREWKVGDWEKKLYSEVPNPFNTTEDPVNGETRLEFEERVIDSVNNLLKESHDNTPLFVSHGAVAHSLFTYLGVDVPYIQNATLYMVQVENMKWKLTEV